MPDGFSFDITTVTADEDRVVVEVGVRATNVAGKVYDNRLVYVLDVRDGKIVHGRRGVSSAAARGAPIRPVFVLAKPSPTNHRAPVLAWKAMA